MDVIFHYEDVGRIQSGRILRPVAKVTLISPVINKKVDVWMVVDTGADYTILPNLFAEKLRISLEHDCVKDITFGAGGNQTIYFYKSKITAIVGKLERKIPIAFFDNNEIPALLGRLGFLETFNVEFLKSHVIVFKD